MSDAQVVAADEDDPFEEFNRAMGADGDATPYPGYVQIRRETAIRNDVMPIEATDGPSMGADDFQLFTAYSYDAVHAVLGDANFSSAGYAAVMGEVFGHSILEMDEPEHKAYRSILQQ